MMKTYSWFIGILFYFVVITPTVVAQIIPANRVVDWTLAGFKGSMPVYSRVVNITSFGGLGNGQISSDGALRNAIASLGGDSGVIYFPAGTYFFVSPITLRSGLVLRGEDATSTTLRFNLGRRSNLITISGNATNDIVPVTSAGLKDKKMVTVSHPSFFKKNDYVKIFQNDSALVSNAHYTVGQILQIKEIAGDTVIFNTPLRRSYLLSAFPRMQRLEMATGVGVECLKIKRLDSTVAPDFQTSNILFRYAAQCWVKGIESDSCNFAHVELNTSTNIDITGSYFHGSFGYGPNGQGYGISAEFTSGECLIENNIFSHLRHSMLFQSGANGNVFAYNYSREPFKSERSPFDLSGDIVLHGNYPYANLIEGNIGQNIVVDVSHYINGPYNTFLRNRAESYGFLVSSGSGDSLNIVSNEITGTGSNKGNYVTNGNGNFEYGNNKNNTIIPGGTDTVYDKSYYYSRTPGFWNVSSPWPAIGFGNGFNSGTIPSKQRFDNAEVLTVCSRNTTLPVRLFSFSASKNGDRNDLSWEVDKLDEIIRFTVERSNDALHYTELGEVRPSHDVNGKSYTFSDYSPADGNNYYRIVQVFLRGDKLYSEVIRLNNSARTPFARVFPNPATDFVQIVLYEEAKNVQATIRSSTGQLITNNFLSTAPRTCTVNISSWAKGVYFIHLQNLLTGELSVLKFIKK